MPKATMVFKANGTPCSSAVPWVETDFMSYLCERLSAENIQLAWLHDAVYVSDESYDRAFEIRESLLDEFERSFK